MRIVTGAYLERASLPMRRPRYVVSIEFGVADLEYFTSHAGIPDVPVGALDGVVKDHSSVSQSVDPETGASSIGSLTVHLGDVADAVTDLIQARNAAGQGLRDKTLRFYKGFDGLSFNDFQLQYTQTIYDVAERHGDYAIACNDLQRQLRADIFPLKKTALAATLSADETTSMTVDDTTAFELVEHGTSYQHGPSATWGYLKIDDEVIGYQAKPTSTTFTTLARGLFGTVAVEHEVDPADPPERRPEVEEYVYLEMPVPKLALALITGELHGQGAATLPDHWHEGVNSALVDITQFEQIGDDLWVPGNDARGLIAYITGVGQTDGKRFIEKELYLLAQIFSPVLADGRLGLKRHAPALASAPPVVFLGPHNVASHGSLRYAYRELYNRVLINWSWITGDFRRQTLLLDADSIATHGEAPIKVFSFRGLASNSATQSVLQQRFDAIRDRFSSPPLHLPVDVSRALDQLEIGDIVRVQLPNVRDMMAESSNEIDRSFEIRRISHSRKGPTKLQLVGSSAKATPVAPEVLALPDAYYDAAGVALSTVVTITGGVTDAGTFNVTGDPSLANAVYYHLGDLTISATTTINITENVQLRVMGHLTINGEINGVAAGLAGVADDLEVDAGPSGQAGYFGSTVGGEGVKPEVLDISVDTFVSVRPDTSVTLGKVGAVPLFNLKVNGNALEGVPTDLRGTSGGPGGKILGVGGGVQELGGTGGDGGAGLMIVARGVSSGGGAGIDLSGGDGTSGTLGIVHGQDFFSGGGAGGAPGALLILLDGDQLVPDLSAVFVATAGSTPLDGTPLPSRMVSIDSFPVEPGTGYAEVAQQFSDMDLSDAASRVQFVPVPQTPVEDLPGLEVFAHYIKPTQGTALHNGVGTLTLEAHRITVFGDELISSGDIKLFDPSNNEITEANGYAAGSDGYTGVFDAGDIDGDLVVALKNGPAGEPLDTITLVDIADGGVNGFVEPSNGLAWTRALDAGAWSPASLTTDLDCTFVHGGIAVARVARRLTLTETSGNIAASTTPHVDGDLNTSRVTVTVTGGGSTAVTVKFDYAFDGFTASVAETAQSTQSGLSRSALVADPNITNQSNWVLTEPDTVSPQDPCIYVSGVGAGGTDVIETTGDSACAFAAAAREGPVFDADLHVNMTIIVTWRARLVDAGNGGSFSSRILPFVVFYNPGDPDHHAGEVFGDVGQHEYTQVDPLNVWHTESAPIRIWDNGIIDSIPAPRLARIGLSIPVGLEQPRLQVDYLDAVIAPGIFGGTLQPGLMFGSISTADPSGIPLDGELWIKHEA